MLLVKAIYEIIYENFDIVTQTLLAYRPDFSEYLQHLASLAWKENLPFPIESLPMMSCYPRLGECMERYHKNLSHKIAHFIFWEILLGEIPKEYVDFLKSFQVKK